MERGRQGGGRRRGLALWTFNHPGDALGGHRHLFRIARKAQSQERLAAGTEGGARREPDARFVDQVKGEATQVRFAFNREQQVESAARYREAAAAARASTSQTTSRLARARAT